MGSTWRRAKAAFGLDLCLHSPRTLGDGEDEESASRFSHAAEAAMTTAESSPSRSGRRALMPSTPTPISNSSGLLISKSGSSASKRTCAICLGAMKAGQGHALFTAECSHIFHFHCIASNVEHGNHVCPICRAKWKEIPLQGPPAAELPQGVSRVNWTQDDGYMNLLRRIHQADAANRQHHHLPHSIQASEPITYDDDEPVSFFHAETVRDAQQQGCVGRLDIKTYPEFSAIAKSASEDSFTVLVRLKAPPAGNMAIPSRSLHSARAPVDLVTVLDVSDSMAGTKLALLKRAMGFVIQTLGPSDRLSVIAFASTARRLFHLRGMSGAGRQQALHAVNSLVPSGGTNIAEGLRKGAKVMEERKGKNPVCSIILLSDGQDTYTFSGAEGNMPDYKSLVPSSIQRGSGGGQRMPVHAFGFGTDHDSASMHTISETSGGTYSFIEAEGVIQDAFAQCIGGLLSVVVQELRVNVDCAHPGVRLAPIKSGGYASRVSENRRAGSIDVGDLYADEERDFLVSINVPAVSCDEVVLLKASCAYKDPVSKESVCLGGEDVKIRRPESVASRTVSIEVDREMNRVRAAEAMAEARAAAEQGLLSEAVSILEARRRMLSESVAGMSGDGMCVALDAEMREMQERMASRRRYEASGRAYVLSGLSSHSWQRATARGDSTDSASLVHAYQTPSMVDMVTRSQILYPPSVQPSPPVRPSKSFSSPVSEPR